MNSDNSLTEKIKTKLKSNSEITDLTELNNFEWNELLILGPYSVIENIEKELNVDLENIKENGIEYSDSINLLVFLKDGKSVKISEVSREVGDFSNSQFLIKKENTKFTKDKNGMNVLAVFFKGKVFKRVGKIPLNAFLIGNEKYLNWVLINSIHNHKNNAQISIYDYESGGLIMRKRFLKICPKSELKLIENLKKEIDFYDGEKIQLKDNCYLQ
ncbi:hypothetical protein [Tenacibaculum sp. nBUS_03]|uniref:hypothetical protein n=1 Tax=Tenacibaculum sp. nBUS_03 TaxID=3395320 RepID=UPI003EB9636C